MLIEELRIANIDLEEACEKDEFVAMLVKFFQASSQGPAFRNLRALAQVLAGKASGLDANTDDFIMWADVIGALTPEEVVLFGTLVRQYERVRAELENEATWEKYAYIWTCEALVAPKGPFESTIEIGDAAAALVRTGLIADVRLAGGSRYRVTKKALQLAKRVRLDEWADDALESLKVKTRE